MAARSAPSRTLSSSAILDDIYVNVTIIKYTLTVSYRLYVQEHVHTPQEWLAPVISHAFCGISRNRHDAYTTGLSMCTCTHGKQAVWTSWRLVVVVIVIIVRNHGFASRQPAHAGRAGQRHCNSRSRLSESIGHIARDKICVANVAMLLRHRSVARDGD